MRGGRGVRLSVRAVLVHRGRLLLVNAWPGRQSDLWCAPGGGVEPHASLPENLMREVHEETGLAITVGAPCLVNEFHDPGRDFHQVDVYFRCTLAGGDPAGAGWTDPEGVVNRRAWVTPGQMPAYRVKPDSLARIAWNPGAGLVYDPLEPIVR